MQDLLFLQPRIARSQVYHALTAEMKERKEKENRASDYLEVGAAFGTDARKAVLDGWNVTALDVVPRYWELGLELFKDAAHPPCPFFGGNIIKDSFLSPHGYEGPVDELNVNPLKSSFDVAHASAVLHCLSEADVQSLLEKVLLLLRPGGTFIGSTLGREVGNEGPWYVFGKNKLPEGEKDVVLEQALERLKLERKQREEARKERGEGKEEKEREVPNEPHWLHSTKTLKAAFEAAGFVEVALRQMTREDIQERVKEQSIPKNEQANKLLDEITQGARLFLLFRAKRPQSQ